MAYIVTRSCIGVLDRSCVEVCPVDCFYRIKKKDLNDRFTKGPAKNPDGSEEWGMMVINPDECITCGACEPECPEGAIFEDTGVPEEHVEWVAYNRDQTAEMSDQELDAARCTSKP